MIIMNHPKMMPKFWSIKVKKWPNYHKSSMRSSNWPMNPFNFDQLKWVNDQSKDWLKLSKDRLNWVNDNYEPS